ncbi:hypothetical protein D3C78_1581230 [compost metagenome]
MIPPKPPSMIRSTWCSSNWRISYGSLNGSSSPGMIRVTLIKGSPSSASNARAMGWLGTRRPMVRFFGCNNSRGTSRVALRMKVYGPGR